MITLLCAHAHPALPALAAGLPLVFSRSTDGQLTVTMPVTPHFLAHVRAAVKDACIVLTDQSPPGLAELEAEIMGERDRLFALAEQKIAEGRDRSRVDLAG